MEWKGNETVSNYYKQKLALYEVKGIFYLFIYLLFEPII